MGNQEPLLLCTARYTNLLTNIYHMEEADDGSQNIIHGGGKPSGSIRCY